MSVFLTLGDGILSGTLATTHGIRRLQAEISSCHKWCKQSRTIDKKWSSTEELGKGIKTAYYKGQHVMKCSTGPQRIGLFEMTYTSEI
jgi:hypothetical protein